MFRFYRPPSRPHKPLLLRPGSSDRLAPALRFLYCLLVPNWHRSEELGSETESATSWSSRTAHSGLIVSARGGRSLLVIGVQRRRTMCPRAGSAAPPRLSCKGLTCI